MPATATATNGTKISQKPATNGQSSTAKPNGSSNSKKLEPTPAPGKAPTASKTTTPTPTATTTAEKSEESTAPVVVGFGKPDANAYHKEQEELKAKIEALQIELAKAKEKIALGGKGAPEGDRRTALRAELDGLRGQQANIKAVRGKTLDQIKALQEGIQKKNKDLQLTRQKTPFKTTAEIDAHIKNLEKQVESGSLTLADEKRALAEISSTKKSRRAVESFQSDQDGIDADRAKIEELRKLLDDPESKAISERFEAIRGLLDELKDEGDKAFANRNKLYEERNKIQEQLNALYTRKRESVQQFKEANDRHWQKMNDERAKKAERLRAARAAEEAEKKKEIIDQLREEARSPAFQAQIEDCQTLIDFLGLKISPGGAAVTTHGPLLSSSKTELAGVPKLELRTVNADVGEGLVARKKKGEEEEAYFVGGKGKKKGGANKTNGTSPAPPSNSNTSQLNIPLPTLTALLSLSIPPPTSLADIPRTIEDLKTKKAWYEANQSRQTAENIAKAEKEIKRIESGIQVAPEAVVADVNGKGSPTPEVPGEPVPTSADKDANAVGNGESTEIVDQGLA